MMRYLTALLTNIYSCRNHTGCRRRHASAFPRSSHLRCCHSRADSCAGGSRWFQYVRPMMRYLTALLTNIYSCRSHTGCRQSHAHASAHPRSSQPTRQAWQCHSRAGSSAISNGSQGIQYVQPIIRYIAAVLTNIFLRRDHTPHRAY
jgi:hypothetical protein